MDIQHITEDQILKVTKQFVGLIQQTPPLHSAIRIEGKRAYEWARKGRERELKSREVEIKEFEITNVQKPWVSFRVVCSKGTYIRSLARDFGNALGVGAYLAELCRTRIGDFKLENALTIDQVS